MDRMNTSDPRDLDTGRPYTDDALNAGTGLGALPEGTPVFGVNGDKLGTVSEHGVQDNCLVIHHGLLRDDLYLPLDTIQRSDPNGVYTSLTKDDLNSLSTNRPPSQDQMAGASGDLMTDTAVPNTARTDTTRADTADYGSDRMRGRDTIDVPVREEELRARKQREQQGNVRVHKDVVEEQQAINVPVTHEEVRVERTPVDRRADVSPDQWQDKDIDVPVMGEQVDVQKQARVADELHIHKQPVTEEKQVTDTVRKERVNVEGVDDQAVDQNPPRR
jgi:uncharacterized protein (TIGR02271 family)